MKHNFLKTTVLLSFIMVLFIVTSCKKEEEVPEPTKTELLSKEWKVVSVNDQTVLEYLEATEAILKIEAAGTFNLKMTMDEVYTVNGSWSWKTNETVLAIVVEGEQIDWRVDKLTATDFWFYDEDEQATFKLVIK